MGEYLKDLGLIAPEMTLTAVALLVLVYDLITKGRDSKRVGYLTVGGLALVTLVLLFQWNDLGGRPAGEPSPVAFGMVTLDLFGTFFKLFTTLSLIVVSLFVLSDRNERADDIGEYFFLLLGAGIGAFFMVSTSNLLLLMLGLELLSLASYSLAGFHKGDKRSAEAAMKYVIFGGLSAGVMLYGISLLYGLTGSIDLREMAASTELAGLLGGRGDVAVAVSAVLILGGFAYKVSVVPFHFWTPDVYEGSPTPVTTFLAVGSKAAGFAVLLRFCGELFASSGVMDTVAAYGARVGTLLALLAAITMTLGNLSALRQASLKRMLAYSSIAHAGYVLMGLAVMNQEGFAAAMFYLAAYYLMNLGAFGALLYFEGVNGTDTIDSLRGQGWKTPAISITLVVFMVSLTGLPPTIGFYGKLALIKAVWAADFGPWLLVVLAVNTVVSLFYYFRPVKALFLGASDDDSRRLPTHGMVATILVALAVLTVFYGLLPGDVSDIVEAGAASLDLAQGAPQ